MVFNSNMFCSSTVDYLQKQCISQLVSIFIYLTPRLLELENYTTGVTVCFKAHLSERHLTSLITQNIR